MSSQTFILTGTGLELWISVGPKSKRIKEQTKIEHMNSLHGQKMQKKKLIETNIYNHGISVYSEKKCRECWEY
jgi:hypothetical protein